MRRYLGLIICLIGTCTSNVYGMCSDDLSVYIQGISDNLDNYNFEILNKYKDDPIDIKGHKYERELGVVYDLGVINVDTLNKLYPDSDVTLLDVCNILGYLYDINGVVGVLNGLDDIYGFNVANMVSWGVISDVSDLSRVITVSELNSISSSICKQLGYQEVVLDKLGSDNVTLGDISYILCSILGK